MVKGAIWTKHSKRLNNGSSQQWSLLEYNETNGLSFVYQKAW
jgi:hypothetical protein